MNARRLGAALPSALGPARCATLAVLLLVAAPVPPAAGQPWAIGRTSATWVDSSRANRPVAVDIYYPAASAGSDVPVAGAPGDRFPGVAFGHGFLMTVDAYANIRDALVPAGYILVLPRTEGGLFPSHQAFGRDLAFVLRRLRREGADPASRFFGRVADPAAAMGHSMGGGASVLAASYDTTITALANLAAAETNPSAVSAAATVRATALMFAGGNDCVTPPPQHQIPIWEALASECRSLVTIIGAGHCQFAESNFNCGLGEASCSPGPAITRATQHAIVDRFLVPWLDWRLKGDAAAAGRYRAAVDSSTDAAVTEECASVAVTPAAPRLALSAAPNPASGALTVRFALESGADVQLEVLDPAGRRVQTLQAGPLPAGAHERRWDGADTAGRPAPPGVYLIVLRAGPEVRTLRIARVR